MPEVTYNGQKYSSESEMGREAMKWEQPLYRPEAHPFPRMMYKAFKGEDGVVRADAGKPIPRHLFPSDQQYDAALAKDAEFNNSCRQEIGRDPNTGQALPRQICEAQHKQALEDGWRDSAEEAIALVRHYETVVKGNAHMARLKADQGMSEKAKAEARAVDASTPDILGEIPEAPTVKKPHHFSKEGRALRAKAAGVPA